MSARRVPPPQLAPEIERMKGEGGERAVGRTLEAGIVDRQYLNNPQAGGGAEGAQLRQVGEVADAFAGSGTERRYRSHDAGDLFRLGRESHRTS
jgi:hypothetical protein